MKKLIVHLRSSRLRWPAALAVVLALAGGGAALAAHVSQLNPATVPTGFLAAHNSVAEVPISALVKAATPDGADVFVQHVRLGANEATGWHTHPGPAIVTVVNGGLTYEDAFANQCRQRTYTAAWPAPGQGFVDKGFGHVHRAIAGPTGAEFYVVYILPPGSVTHVIPTSPAPECVS